jgi:ABC-type Fe3+-hydroxamate transport system substrate-binding protein
MNKFIKAGFAGLFLSFATVLSACGGSSTSTDTTVAMASEAVYPVTVGDLTLDAQPMRIISLSPHEPSSSLLWLHQNRSHGRLTP